MRRFLIVFVALILAQFSFTTASDSFLLDSQEQHFKIATRKNMLIAKTTLKNKANEIESFYNSIPQDGLIEKDEIDSLNYLLKSFAEASRELNDDLNEFGRQIDIPLNMKYQKVCDWYHSYLWGDQALACYDSIKAQFVKDGHGLAIQNKGLSFKGIATYSLIAISIMILLVAIISFVVIRDIANRFHSHDDS